MEGRRQDRHGRGEGTSAHRFPVRSFDRKLTDSSLSSLRTRRSRFTRPGRSRFTSRTCSTSPPSTTHPPPPLDRTLSPTPLWRRSTRRTMSSCQWATSPATPSRRRMTTPFSPRACPSRSTPLPPRPLPTMSRRRWMISIFAPQRRSASGSARTSRRAPALRPPPTRCRSS